MTDRAKYWQRMMTAWKASGLTQAEFCRRRGLKRDNFSWWKRQLVGSAKIGGAGGTGGPGRRRSPVTQRKAVTKPKSRPAFAEVTLPGTQLAARLATSRKPKKARATDTPPDSRYEVTLSCGVSIHLPAEFDVDKVSQLIFAVTRSC